MKKRKSLISVMLAMLFVLCGCGSGVVVQDRVDRRTSTGDSWTIMIYMCGSTLEEAYGSASNALDSMAYNLPENINVVVETGGSRSWNISDIYSEYQQDFVVQKNGLRLVNQSAASNMGESGTLQRFLEWGIENYPAKHYMTIIWDHGGGPVGGVAYDSNYRFDSLSLEELKAAFAGVSVKMDIIGFDASLMSNIETASALNLYGNYMVASEDIIPAGGWDYKSLFKYISENPSASEVDIGKNICDKIADNITTAEEYFLSMAVTDLSGYSKLSQAFDGAAAKMTDALDSAASLRSLQSAIRKMEYLGGNSQWEGYSNLVDMGSLASALSNRTDRVGEKLINAVNETVVYKRLSKYREELSGLGVYYPSNRRSSEINKFQEFCDSENYIEFIEKTCIDIDTPEQRYNYADCEAWTQYNENDKEISIQSSCDISGEMLMTSSDIGFIKSAAVKYYIYNEKTARNLYLCTDSSPEFDSLKSGYKYKLKNTLPVLNGIPVSMYYVSCNSRYEIYSIPVMQEGVLKNIRVAKQITGKTTGTYDFLCMWEGVGKFTGMADRKATGLETGDVITPLYEVYGGSNAQYVEGRPVRMGLGSVSISEKKIKDGDYIAVYTAEDIYNKVYESNFISFSTSKGRIKVTSD